MPEVSDEKKLNLIQSIINEVGMRFPVATIAKKTGFNRGYVSSILQGKRPISDNFFDAFSKHFANTNEKIVEVEDEPELITMEVDKLVELIQGAEARVLEKEEARRQDAEARLKSAEQMNERLLALLELNLGKATSMLQSVMTMVSAHDSVVMKAIDRLEKKPEGTLAAESDKLEMEINQKLNNPAGSDKKIVVDK